jgi:hypothetical protein
MRNCSKPFICTYLAAALLFLLGCTTTIEKPEGIPLTPEEIEFLEKLHDPSTFSVIEEVPALFFRLNQLLKSWQDSSIFKNSKKHRTIYTNLGAMLTRRVYLNFDKILNQLEEGSQPNRVIAASALGFCRIPDDPEFEQVYPEAIPALLRALESGDDAVTQNALLSLKILGDPDTPLEGILPLMTEHHNPEVRSNAALCLSAIVSPAHSDLVTPYVLPALRDDDPKVRNHAINIVLRLKDPSTVRTLIEMMDDRYELIQANAARALGELGDPAACSVLITNLNHVKEIVRSYCLRSLQKLSGKDYGFNQEKWTEWWTDYLKDNA